MRFANVDSQRQEAQPGLSGECQSCQRPMIAKCGERRVWHWSHLTKRSCDPWWENEGEWHRAWKGHFPVDWQEVIHPAENGMKHIADVKTAHGWVIEFQHSPIKPNERRSRDAFYGKLVWVVDGLRSQRDKSRFMKAWEDGVRIGSRNELKMLWRHDVALLREWAGGEGPVFFDFGEEQTLWWLLGTPNDTWVYVGQFPRALFIELHRSGDEARGFGIVVKDTLGQLAAYESNQRALASRQAQQQQQDPLQLLLGRSRRHRRF
jgi:competence protein CoiA